MKPLYFGLREDNEPFPMTDPAAWNEHMGDLVRTRRRHVGLDEIGQLRVSTVFLGIDHNFGRTGPPLFFETMVFGNGYQERYCTWQEAKDGHARVVAWLRNRYCGEITDEEAGREVPRVR
jgi:hypothetical protein